MMCVHAQGHGCARGFTLIEVLVALFVLSIAMLGVAGLQVTSKRANFESVQRTNATLLMQELLERLRNNADQLTVYTAAGTGRTLTFSGNDGLAAVNCSTATCDPATLALYDLYEFSQAVQGVAELAGGNAAGGLMEPTVCISGPATTPGTVQLAIAWRGMQALSNPTSNACGSGTGRYDDGAVADARRRVIAINAYVE